MESTTSSLIASTNVSAGDGDDVRDSETIRRDIERRRESIARTVDQAGQKIHDSLSWREQLREHPYGTLAAVAGAGFVLARVLRARGTATERLAATVADDVKEILTGVARPRHGLASGLGAVLTTVATQWALDAFRARALRPAVTEMEPPTDDEGSHG
ncbi:MAG TPA: DUF3618 domain-containing protein [Candidatus Binatia bacterium]|nr:DUF3618 domain-containing protein [Candidatus Binatia bacterium]